MLTGFLFCTESTSHSMPTTSQCTTFWAAPTIQDCGQYDQKGQHQLVLTFPGCILHTSLGGDEMCAVDYFEFFEPRTTFLDHALDGVCKPLVASRTLS